jgi:hypothetical protein
LPLTTPYMYLNVRAHIPSLLHDVTICVTEI